MTALAQSVIGAAKAAGLTIAVAESCTGGGLGAALTSVAGASSVFKGGVIAYANSAKINVLGVNQKTIAEHGAVSIRAAEEMTAGAAALLGTDIAVSVTGIAGPGGGTAEKPVGTVCFGMHSPRGTFAETRQFGALPRAEIQGRSTAHALKLLAAEIQIMASTE